MGIFRFLYSERVSEVWENKIQYILIYKYKRIMKITVFPLGLIVKLV